ncbi:MAG: oligosaccharide flippase family protein [Chitinophagaceae bacterium]|nr:oligosaccharide flippase family protein [Chitinophagaceae bacterium]
MIKKYFLSNLLLMLLLNILIKPIWIFFIDRNVQLTVGHEAYGLYSALASLSIIFNILLDFGITNYNNKNLAADTSSLQTAMPNMIVTKLMLSLVYLFIVMLAGLFLGYTSHALYLLLLLAFIQLLNSFLQYLRSNVSAHHDFKIDSVLSVADKIIMIGICGFLLFHEDYKKIFILEWFIYAQIIAYACSILLSVTIIIRRYSGIHFKHISMAEMKGVFRSSIPYAVLILLMGAYMRSDMLMLERMEGSLQSSLYVQAFRILDAVNMMGFLFAGILLPMFARMISKAMPVSELLRTSNNIMLSVSLGIMAHSLIYGQDIMNLLYHDGSSAMHWIYGLVISAFPAYCLMYSYSTLLTAKGKIQLLIYIALLGTVTSILSNLILIPYLQARGAAWTALFVQWLLAFIYMVACIRIFNLKLSLIWPLKFIGLFGLLLMLNLLLKNLSIGLYVSLPVNLLSFIVLVYLIRLWDMNLLKGMLKQYKSPA